MADQSLCCIRSASLLYHGGLPHRLSLLEHVSLQHASLPAACQLACSKQISPCVLRPCGDRKLSLQQGLNGQEIRKAIKTCEAFVALYSANYASKQSTNTTIGEFKTAHASHKPIIALHHTGAWPPGDGLQEFVEGVDYQSMDPTVSREPEDIPKDLAALLMQVGVQPIRAVIAVLDPPPAGMPVAHAASLQVRA